MKAAKIKKQFQHYIDSRDDLSAFREHSEEVAALFGSDEIKIDVAKGRVRLPDFGWFTVDRVIPKKRIAWAAVIKESDQYLIALGEGMSPFSEQAKEILPVLNDTILAMPYIDSARIKDKMVAT